MAEDPVRRGDWAATALLSAAAIVPRLYVALAWAREPVWDGHYYDFGARRIAGGFGYSDDVIRNGVATWHPWCHYPVGYSGFLAIVYKVFGNGPHVATLANAVLGALTVALAHRVARHHLSTWRARAAAVLCAASPALIVYSGLVMTEVLSAFLLLLTLWLAVLERERAPWRGAITSGVALGLSTLVHPQFMVLAPGIAFVLTPAGGGVGGRLKRFAAWGALCTGVAVATVLPWTIRNCRVMDGCAFVSTNGGWNLAIGSFPRATGRFETLRATDGCEIVTGQVQQDQCWARQGVRYILTDTKRWLGLAPKKLANSFNHESFAIEYLREANPGAWPEARRVLWRERLTGAHWLLLTLAALGFIGIPAREQLANKRWGVLAAELIAALLVVGLAWHAWRDDYHPFYPLAIAMAVLALSPRPGAPRWEPVTVFAGWAIATFLVVHIVFFGEDRYHVPFIPLFALAAASIGRRPRVRQEERTPLDRVG